MSDAIDTDDAAQQAERDAALECRREQWNARNRRWLPLPIVALPTMLVSAIWVFHHLDDPRVGAHGGFAALCVVAILASDYFWTPRVGQPIRAPNPVIRGTAGVVAVYSAALWMIDSVFNG